ncbi:MAG: GNAT family N-acetyltransferase, partial [Thermodesulfobacteriota bacterium]
MAEKFDEWSNHLITFAPLPPWSDLAAIFSSQSLDDQRLAKPWCREGDHAFWFSRSAWSMYAIVLWWESYFGKENPSIWVPDYFCNQSLWPIRQTSAKVSFYPIRSDLRPNWETCQEMANKKPLDIFVLVHYFGDPSDSLEAKRFCNKIGSILIEDAAHVLKPIPGVGEKGDFVLYSPHKLLPVPDGAVCVMRLSLDGLGGLGSAGQVLKTMYDVTQKMEETSPSSWGWLTKRLIQKIFSFNGFRSVQNDMIYAFDEDPVRVDFKIPPRLSTTGRNLLGRVGGCLPHIAEQRQKNDRAWRYLLEKKPGLAPLFDRVSSETVPYLAVFQGDNPELARTAYDQLRRDGWPVQTWPDMPPEVMANQEFHAIAIQRRRSLLTFPVHQSVHANQLAFNYLRRQGVTNPLDQIECRLVWDQIDRTEWERMLVLAGKSNLLQSWAYGEAKEKAEGWKAKRGLVLKEGQPVAILQALEKKWPIGGCVVRINRGPLWLREPESDREISTVFTLIRRLWPRWRRRILLIAPELRNTVSNSMILSALGYRSRQRSGWRSAWVDLNKTEEELRKGLNGKWRNQLKYGEKSGLELNVSFSDKDFQWLMEQYRETQKTKGFRGPSIELLNCLYEYRPEEHYLLIMQAVHGNRPAAGILVARHGLASTYLVGWNGPEGRKLNANNFLLWNATLELKRR